jgi:hypothetical protein
VVRGVDAAVPEGAQAILIDGCFSRPAHGAWRTVFHKPGPDPGASDVDGVPSCQRSSPGEGDFLRAFSKAGYKNAQSLYMQMTAQSPEFKLSPVKLNPWATSCRVRRMRVAPRSCSSWPPPSSPNMAMPSTARVKPTRRLANATAAYEKAVAVDKTQVNAMAWIKALQSGAGK